MREIVSVFNSNGAYATAPHEHREFMVLVPEHGMLRFTDEANNWSTTLIERQFLLVPPHWTHSSASLTGDQGHVAFYVDPDYMGYALGDLSGEASRVLRVPTLGIWHTSAPLHHLLLAKKELRRPSPFVDRRRQVAQADHLLLLECLAISLSQPSVRRSSTERHGAALVRDVRAYLAGNLARAPDLDEVAATFHVSRRHLTRLFAQHAGGSILAYVQRLRVERAKNLLRQTRLSVLEVAHAVGLESPSHLAGLFRREVGSSPDDWRRAGQH